TTHRSRPRVRSRSSFSSDSAAASTRAPNSDDDMKTTPRSFQGGGPARPHGTTRTNKLVKDHGLKPKRRKGGPGILSCGSLFGTPTAQHATKEHDQHLDTPAALFPAPRTSEDYTVRGGHKQEQPVQQQPIVEAGSTSWMLNGWTRSGGQEPQQQEARQQQGRTTKPAN
ncbi:unnamed protein product, partial [Amoebophrya sp. A120]